MDTSLIGAEAVDLLSRITGQKLSQRELTPPVIFLTALVTVLLGVMLADGTITDEEKQRWQKTITQFIPPEDNARQFTQLLSKGIRQNQIYKKVNELLTLTAPLSESERLLLIGFGYEMSAADGDMDAREKKYLEAVANRLGINPRYLAVLEAGFSHQGTIEPAALDEVQFLLAPARFHELDSIFVKAASDMLAALPSQPEHKGTQQQRVTSYQQLQDFQKYRQQLSNFCNQLFQIIQDCADSGFMPETLTKEIGKVSQKLQSHRFRVAVVGEFNQGKSTLLNALLGEEIQPVRAIPCSGTVTVLKYGARKRVICLYKDGQEEEIPFEQYQVKAAISEEAAINSFSDELTDSNIDEIIFEHPDLNLCSSGVEIVDTPGLNEHPERTALTQKLLKDADAAIFLTNALKPLTFAERQLVEDLRTQLNGGEADAPADNLFILVNFMDLQRKEKDRQQVRQLVESSVLGRNPVVTGDNRVHFISAQAALDAILEGTENEYLQNFKAFTESLEDFLIIERGEKFMKSVLKLPGLIQSSLDALLQSKDILDSKLNLSEVERQKILEQMGEASGRDVKIRYESDRYQEQAIEQARELWKQWNQGISEKIEDKSKSWKSKYSHIFQQKELIRDYTNQFTSDLRKEIDSWGSTKLRDEILKPSAEKLERLIRQELEALQENLKTIDRQINTNFSQQMNFRITGINDDICGAGGFLGGIGAGGALAAGLVFAGIAIIPIIIAAVVAGIAGSFGLGLLDVDGIHDKIKLKVCEEGLQKLNENQAEITKRLDEIISSAFSSQVEVAETAIKQIISSYENLLEQQDKAHKATLEQREADQAWISQKRNELEQVQRNIEAILHS
jgi:uncharacterized tellurite resistance protein B-like protein/GTPase Era involved in 16S rRNA processing